MVRDVRGAKLFYKENGRGGLLIAVHGTGASADIWDGVLPILAERRHVVAYDRRGWARSEGEPPHRQTYNQEQGRDLAAFIQSFGAGPATVVATSAGGFYAIHAALEAPELVARLVLHEPPLHASRHPSFDMVKVAVKVLALRAFGRKKAATRTFVGSLLAGCGGRDVLSSLPREFRQNLDAMVEPFWAEVGVGSGEEITNGMIVGLQVPTSFILGSCSAPPVQNAMKRLVALCPGVPLIPLAGGHHAAMIDAPAAFAAAVEEAIAMATPPRPAATRGPSLPGSSLHV